jgi:protein ImuA
MHSSKRQVLQQLAGQIQQIESGRRRNSADGSTIRIAALDALLPHDGLPRGAFVELLATADGAGAWTLGIVMAARVCPKRKTLVVVDAGRQFYFPGAVRLGLELSRSIVVRPDTRRDAYQAIVQSLRSSAVGAVLSCQERLSMRQLRRLQLAADAGGGVAILLRPAAVLGDPSCAAVRLLVSPHPSAQPLHRGEGRGVGVNGSQAGRHFFTRGSYSERPWMRHVRVEVLRCRGRAYGESLVLEIDDETGDVHTPAALATATAMARSARASG